MKAKLILKDKSSFTTDEAREHGLSPRMFSYYVKNREIERIARGAYRFADDIRKEK